MRRTLIIIGIIVIIVAIVGGGAWFALRGDGDNALTPTTSNETPGALPDPSTGDGTGSQDQPEPQNQLETADFGIVVDSAIVSYGVDPTNNVFSITTGGTLLKTTEGNTTELASLAHNPVLAGRFSPNANSLLYSWQDGQETRWSVFEKETESERTLPQGAIHPNWSPNGSLVTYLDTSNTYSALSTLDTSSNASPSRLMSFSATNLIPRWISSNNILISESPTGYSETSVWMFDIARRQLSRVASAPGATVKWGPASQGLLFTAGNGQKGGELSIINKAGQKILNILFSTLPDKCIFKTENSLVCAVPQNVDEFNQQTLPDDYYTRQYMPADDIVQLRLTDSAFEVLQSPTASLDAHKLSITNETLFFVDRNTGRLYGLSLNEN